MSTVISKDGTNIAYDKQGSGPDVVIVGGTLGDRSQQAPVAALLASQFTVYNFDRRAHGESGDTAPYAVQREVEDIEAIIDAAGGSAFVYSTSGCAVLSLEAAATSVGTKIKKLALWEPSYIVAGSRPPVPSDYLAQLKDMLAAGKRGDMVEYFMTAAVGLPAQMVGFMRQSPWWPAQEALAHTLIYDATLVGDYAIPTERLAKVNVSTLVLDGGTMPWLSTSADAVAKAVPNAQRRTLAGQQHNVEPEAIAPVLAEYFNS